MIWKGNNRKPSKNSLQTYARLENTCHVSSDTSITRGRQWKRKQIPRSPREKCSWNSKVTQWCVLRKHWGLSHQRVTMCALFKPERGCWLLVSLSIRVLNFSHPDTSWQHSPLSTRIKAKSNSSFSLAGLALSLWEVA